MSVAVVLAGAGCGDNLTLALQPGSGGAAGSGKGGSTGTGGVAGHGGTTVASGGRGGSGAAGATGSGGSAGRGASGGAAGQGSGGAATGGDIGTGGAGGDTGTGGLGGTTSTGGAGGGPAGTLPVVTFTTPTAASKLCGSGNTKNGCLADSDGTTAGWQGTITVHVVVDGQPLTSGNVNLGIGSLAFTSKGLDASGNASFTGVTVPEGPSLALVARTDDVPGHGVGSATLSMVVDTVPPQMQITQLMTAVTDRRKATVKLSWTAPSDGTAAVGGYVIKQSTSAIAADATFDAATDLPFTGTPKAGGMTESIDVTDLYIQKPYYFAIRAMDAVGNLGPITIASAPAMATFNQTIITPPVGGPAGQAFGYSVDGADDVFLSTMASNRTTHLIIGNDGPRRQVYMYTGSGFSAATPSAQPPITTTFTGTTDWYGIDVCFTGDLDGDGRSEVAIAAPKDGTGKVYVFKGRDTWPATLTQAMADWTFVGSAKYNAGFQGMGYAMARAGDFNGDGKNDFAIGTWTYGGSGIGRVDVVLGGTLPAPPATIMMPGDAPAAPPAQVITIDGDPSFSFGSFGDTLTSLANGTDTILMVGASYAGAASSQKGRVYAYHKRTLAGGSRLTFADADAFVEGSVTGAQLGENIGNNGWLTPAMPSIALAAPYGMLATPASRGFVQIYSGTTTNPFSGTPITIGSTKSTKTLDYFGFVVIGGGFSGQTRTMSILKSTVPDLLLAGQQEGAGTANLYIFDGAVLPTLTSPIDAATQATVTVPLPAGWVATSLRSRGLPDLDGDGYEDIAIGENVSPGRMLILW